MKNYFKLAAVVITASFAGVSFLLSNNSKTLSDIQKDNIEALALCAPRCVYEIGWPRCYETRADATYYCPAGKMAGCGMLYNKRAIDD